jgi:hypothetical protein
MVQNFQRCNGKTHISHQPIQQLAIRLSSIEIENVRKELYCTMEKPCKGLVVGQFRDAGAGFVNLLVWSK